jgi:CRP-like cAMP-binding protein
VAAYLLDGTPEDADTFKLNIPKNLIASRVSVKPETFSRILKELAEKDIVSVKGGEITILDREALKEMSAGR